MKRVILLFVAAIIATLGYSQSVTINFKNGNTVNYGMGEVESIVFDEGTTNDAFGTVADVVDLGLSVKWASWNVGASKIADYGGLYGAGDPTGLKTSTNYHDYYWKDGESICGTEYDLAHVKWGDKWQLPTIEQLKELKEKCTWEHNVTIDGVKGSIATGPNGNTLFFPYAGALDGTGISYLDKHTSLWSGNTCNTPYLYGYKDLDINLPSGEISIDTGRSYFKQSIRPVYVDDVNSEISIETKIFDANSQPMLVGGFIENYSKQNVSKKGIIVSKSADDMIITDETIFDKSEPLLRESLHKDIQFIDCTDTNEEQYVCALLYLYGNTDYFVKAFVIDTDNNVIYGRTEKIHTQDYNRYDGRGDYANVWYAFDHTLFDLVTDEIINPNDGFYYSTNENPTTLRYQVGSSYNTCYKFKTEWNYKLWYYHSGHCNQSKIIHAPMMSYKDGRLIVEKNPLDADKDITIYYSINGNYFRPENYKEIYSQPLSITEPCAVYCYAISSDGYISYTNIYVIGDYTIKNEDNYNSNSDFGTVADVVDLGLSVKWASWNVGASKIADYGGLYGAGDPTGLKTSTSYSDYYWKNGESICGTEYDLVHVKWGEPWRMPTWNELEELKTRCTWSDGEIDGIKGSWVTGPNGNSIFLPWAGYRKGDNISIRNEGGEYWSGDMGVPNHSNGYKDLDIGPGGVVNTDGGSNYVGQSIRPVYAEESTNNEGDNDNSIVGVWEVTAMDCSIPGLSATGDKMYLNADGTYKDPSYKGFWTLNGSTLIITYDEGGVAEYNVVSLTSTNLTIKLLNREYSLTMYLKRVNDSNGDDDNNGDVPASGDYLQVDYNGKTYTENMPIYAQIQPFGTDSQNRKLTYTYDMVAHFEDNGFSFMIGLVHLTSESELLASSTGTYGCAKDIFDDNMYQNLTLVTLLEVNYDEYNWVSGSHQVKSIKKVNGDVQIEGSFTSSFELDGDRKTVKGSYRMTIP